MTRRKTLVISRLEQVTMPWRNLLGYLIGKGIVNNPNIVRFDDPATGGIVFYEEAKP